MPDVHLGKLINNGSVIATSHLVYPQAVGGDIGCGLSVIGFNGTAEVLRSDRHAGALIQEIYQRVPALKQRSPQVLPKKLSAVQLSDTRLATESRRDGAY